MNFFYRIGTHRGSFIAVVLLLPTVSVMAIDVEMLEPPTEHAADASEWALNFQIGEDFTLKSFDGMMVSVTHHNTPSSAIRCGLDLSIVSSADEHDGERRSESSSRDVELSVLLMRYTRGTSKPALYWGIGPILSYEAAERELHQTGDDGEVQQEETLSWGVGAGGVLGIEWLVTEDVALLAEYGVAAEYRKRTRDQCPASIEDESSSFIFSSSGVRFGISVYL